MAPETGACIVSSAPIVKPKEPEINSAWFRGRSLREPILIDPSALRTGANGLCCAVIGCETCRYQIERLSPNARFICKRHPRQAQVEAFQKYVPARADYDSTKDRKDAQVHFQKHLLHAAQGVNTSASLRWLVEPKSPSQFLAPTPEEFERLRAASAEYYRRVQESYLSTKQIGSSYDLRINAGESFQLRPTDEQIEEWDQKLRDRMREDYRREREQADVILHDYIAELQRELRSTNDPVRRAELRQRILEMLLVDPFHVAEPKTGPEINRIETEMGSQGMTRVRLFRDESGENLDVFEIIPDHPVIPKSQKKRVRLTLERITKTYVKHTTKARQKRIENLIQQGDPNKLCESKDFQRLLADVLVLNEGLEPWQVALVTDENPETVKKSALRLYHAALALQETVDTKVARFCPPVHQSIGRKYHEQSARNERITT